MEIFLFTQDAELGREAAAQGMDGLVVDWESNDKHLRQRGYDTEINHGSRQDLQSMRAATSALLVCRIDNHAGGVASQVDEAVALGADEIWLPMVRHAGEVERCLAQLDGRARLGVLAETREAAALGREFAELPLSRVYFGLNDYRIDAGKSHLFEALIDGTVDEFRSNYPGPFGVAGITRPDGGTPIPQRLLLAEMVRLGCTFAIARRSFRAEVPRAEMGAVIGGIHEQVRALERRRPPEIRGDREALWAAVRSSAPTSTTAVG